MSRPLQPCGTYAAWQRHYSAREEPCEPCQQARLEYQRTYRKRVPPKETEKRKARRRAERRALYGLAARYAVAFDALLDQELTKEGITR